MDFYDQIKSLSSGYARYIGTPVLPSNPLPSSKSPSPLLSRSFDYEDHGYQSAPLVKVSGLLPTATTPKVLPPLIPASCLNFDLFLPLLAAGHSPEW